MKKNFARLLIFLVICMVGAIWAEHNAKAQSGSVVYIAPAAGTTLTNCGTPTTGFPMCGVATGWYVWNGTAWIQIGVVTAAGVTSVNGKTGAVTISATSTTSTTLQ